MLFIPNSSSEKQLDSVPHAAQFLLPSTPGPCLGFSCPCFAVSHIPCRISSLLPTHTPLWHYNKGEHSYPSWGHFAEKTGSPLQKQFCFLARLHEQDSGFLKKKKSSPWFHQYTAFPKSFKPISGFIGLLTWDCFYSQKEKIKLLIHSF